MPRVERLPDGRWRVDKSDTGRRTDHYDNLTDMPDPPRDTVALLALMEPGARIEGVNALRVDNDVYWVFTDS